MPRVQAILNSNPDLAYSRLLCPRLLDVNTGYDAFVIPAFESGTARGLGSRSVEGAFCHSPRPGRPTPASRSRKTFLITIRWHFRTGDRGDFRYLVSLLKPQPVDPTVGTRDFDVTDPGRIFPASSLPD